MKNILLFGAGKSATVLIEYLIQEAAIENWLLNIIDTNKEIIEQKTKNNPLSKALVFNIEKDEKERQSAIQNSDIVISLLPPSLHILVAKDCLLFKKNLLTASYVDEAVKMLEKDIKENDLLFLYEMGLDPGIDHMSAMEMIETIQKNNGKITSFTSHCGGLVAPESDDNPWHYKISWNPRNVVMAGKAGAEYLWKNEEIKLNYNQLFDNDNSVFINGLFNLSYYANRDSLSYMPLYNLQDCPNFLRTTLRHSDFMYGWKNIIELNLTNEEKCYNTNGKTLSQVFNEHLEKQNFKEWLIKKTLDNFQNTKHLLHNLQELEKAEKDVKHLETDFLSVNNSGELIINNDEENKSEIIIANQMHLNNIALKLLVYLGIEDNETIVNLGLCSAADILQFALEQKLKLQPTDKDMIIMQHEIEYLQNNIATKKVSTLIVKGNDATHTAMAKTVGLPLGIAAKLILNNSINLKGLHIPIKKEIYQPVLKELRKFGIEFNEK